MKSYHRFIGTTNSEDPLPTEKGDRRNLLIRSSDEKKGDVAYFNQMYEYMNDMNVIRTLYDYFMGIPNMDKFHEIPLPMTEFQNDLKLSNRSPIEMWLEDFTRDNSAKETVSLQCKEMFVLFSAWLSSSNIRYDVNCVKFCLRLKNLHIPGIETEHSRSGNSKVFDIAKLEVYFGIIDPPVVGASTEPVKEPDVVTAPAKTEVEEEEYDEEIITTEVTINAVMYLKDNEDNLYDIQSLEFLRNIND